MDEIIEYSNEDLDHILLKQSRIALSWDKRWNIRGFGLGEGLISPDRRYFYLNIPKNASSTIKTILKSRGWEFSTIPECPDAKIIVILRDPMSRWISGIAEYLSMYHQKVLESTVDPTKYGYHSLLADKLGINLIFDNITFDDHTERQAFFLKDINFNRCVWLYLDENLSSNFSKLLEELEYYGDFDITEKENSTDDIKNFRKKKIKELFELIINSEDEKRDILKKWFWCDYELINRVKFYD